jgi:signal transduction histidine kinase
MRLPPEGARWLISLRWIACATVFAVAILAWRVLGVLPDPIPICGVAVAMVGVNVWFWISQRDYGVGEANVDRFVFQQITHDLVALALLVYFSDATRNPFLFFFVFHMIIGSMYLHGWMPYVVAGMASLLTGGIFLLEYARGEPSFPIHLPTDAPGARTLDGVYLLWLFLALVSTFWLTVYLTTAMHRYVDRAHSELRQKEKMVGMGQLVAGIAHQIANPLDGMQNCLNRIGESVREDPQLAEYVRMMADALERIERTAKRVQTFAQPRGITLQRTEVNTAVEATLQVLGSVHPGKIRIETKYGKVPAVQGDPYSLQEVLFNLCTNALAAMPDGGTLTLRTVVVTRPNENDPGTVAVEVSDTGKGIPEDLQDKVFEPFFTTRGESGGTGLGLALSRMMISEMGGRLQLESAPGHGTTFSVILKAAADTAPESA